MLDQKTRDSNASIGQAARYSANVVRAKRREQEAFDALRLAKLDRMNAEDEQAHFVRYGHTKFL